MSRGQGLAKAKEGDMRPSLDENKMQVLKGISTLFYGTCKAVLKFTWFAFVLFPNFSGKN